MRNKEWKTVVVELVVQVENVVRCALPLETFFVVKSAELRCRADADLSLLSTRRLPPDAFKGKVVWLTGASQVAACFSQPPATLYSVQYSTYGHIHKLTVVCEAWLPGAACSVLPQNSHDPGQHSI